MLKVSEEFKEAARAPVKTLQAKVTFMDKDGGEPVVFTSGDNLISVGLEQTGELFNAAMATATVKVLGTDHDLKDKTARIEIELLADSDTLTLDYGSFEVDETPVALDKETTTIRLYDTMARMQNELYNVGSVEFPITVSALAKAVADWFQLSVSDTSTLPNAAYEIKEPLYDTISNINYRNIVAEVAGATATMARVDRVAQCIVFSPPPMESLETLTYDNLKSVEIKDHYGPVNSVVIARTPQEDNIVVTDDESLQTHQLTEVKLANNEIMDDEREVFAQPILDAVDGLEWTGFECTTEGHGWYEVGDRLTITDGTNSWEVVVTDISLTIDGGFKETLKGVIPTETTTDYALAGGIMRTIYNTEIKVDKQNQTIESMVSRQEAFEGQVTEQFTRIEQNLTSITTTIQTTGGGNLIHNSVGYNVGPDKKLVNWEQTGTVGSSSSPESRSYGAISGSQIDMAKSSTLTQRISVDASGSQLYTLSFKAKKSVSGIAKVHLQNELDDYIIELPAGKEVLWGSFSQVAVRPSMNYFDLFIETDEELASFSITDLLLIVGDSVTPWVAASDEILSKSVAVDGTGVTVRSSTSNDYVKLDELGLNGYSDASGTMENVFTINRDTTEVMKLTARKQIAMPPLRIVPMQDGWAFVPYE